MSSQTGPALGFPIRCLIRLLLVNALPAAQTSSAAWEEIKRVQRLVSAARRASSRGQPQAKPHPNGA